MSGIRKMVHGKLHCSGECGQWKTPDQFYGKTTKQSRCIPCYNAAYGTYYRAALREARV